MKKRWLRRSPRAKSINGVVVCKACRNGFASRRQGAYLIDWMILYILESAGAWALVNFAGSDWLASAPASYEISQVLGFIVLPLAFCLRDSINGRSPGKWLLGLQTIRWDDHDPVGPVLSLKRNLCLMIPYVPFVLAFTLAKGWRAGDLWANTRVIWLKHAYKAPFDPRGVVCVGCGYDLTGNVSGVCPECGRVVGRRPDDALDGKAFHEQRPAGKPVPQS